MDIKTLNLLFLAMAASFLLTVGLSAFLVRRAKPSHRLYWIVGCSIASVVWLGIFKGLAASTIAIAFSSGYVSTRLDARRIGKRVADSMGVERNLFFTSLENALPMYLQALAQLERQGLGTIEARRVLLPYVVTGLHALEGRFGQQPQINAALETIAPYLKEHENANNCT